MNIFHLYFIYVVTQNVDKSKIRSFTGVRGLLDTPVSHSKNDYLYSLLKDLLTTHRTLRKVVPETLPDTHGLFVPEVN